MPRVRRLTTIGSSYDAVRRLAIEDADLLLGASSQAPQEFQGEFLGVKLTESMKVRTTGTETVDQPISAVVLPFELAPAEHEAWLPIMRGEFEMTPTRSGVVEVAMEARYDVPGGVAGIVGDAVVLHKVAERSIDRYFEEVVDRLRRGSTSLDALSGIPV